MYKPGFKEGDTITFCGEDYLVIRNQGHKGIVKELNGTDVISNFLWEYEGEKCVLKDG